MTLYQVTAERNIQYDTYENPKEMTKYVRSQQITRISDEPEYQGYIVKYMWSHSSEILKNLWTQVRDLLRVDNYSFTVQYLKNTLPTIKDMS